MTMWLYVTGRMRENINTISYVGHCTVVELELEQPLVVVGLVD